MTTTTMPKTECTTTWTTEKIQQMNARVLADTMMTTMSLLAKQGPEAITEFQALNRAEQVRYYKELGVKTPFELIKAKAEFETNVFGSKVEYYGDEKVAYLEYKTCAVWEAMKARGLSPEQEEKMGESFQTCIEGFAKEFGFTGQVRFEGECATVTITR